MKRTSKLYRMALLMLGIDYGIEEMRLIMKTLTDIQAQIADLKTNVQKLVVQGQTPVPQDLQPLADALTEVNNVVLAALTPETPAKALPAITY